MGCFGYICVGCGKSIRYGERAVLKHIRHGEVLGETVGTYDSYGRVMEDSTYRSFDPNNINGHDEICKSEFDLSDSEGCRGKLYKGKPVKWLEYRKIKVGEGIEDLSQEMYDEWDNLMAVLPSQVKSGTEAWHEYCYNRATEETKDQHRISEGDPDQSWGNPRKKYMG